MEFSEVVEYLWNSQLLRNYIVLIPKRIPLYAYLITLCVVFLYTAFLIYRNGYQSGIRAFASSILIGYLFLIIISTCLLRETLDDRIFYHQPFWSYSEIIKGNKCFIVENLMNVVAFVPIGFLIPFSQRRNSNIKDAIILGGCVSIFIEIFQFIFRKGYSEFDDIFHNILGTIIGYLLYLIISHILIKIMGFGFHECKNMKNNIGFVFERSENMEQDVVLPQQSN